MDVGHLGRFLMQGVRSQMEEGEGLLVDASPAALLTPQSGYSSKPLRSWTATSFGLAAAAELLDAMIDK